jgi:ferrous iron transport protein A
LPFSASNTVTFETDLEVGSFYSGVLPLRVLSDLEVGERGVIVSLDLPPGVENHLMYMGFVPEAQVKAVHRAPVGDPTVYSIDGMEIALRRETAKRIQVAPVPKAPHAQQNKQEAAPLPVHEELVGVSR